jgi:hypothetical protein
MTTTTNKVPLTIPFVMQSNFSEVQKAYYMFLSEYARGLYKGHSCGHCRDEAVRIACSTFDVEESHISALLSTARLYDVSYRVQFIADGREHTAILHCGRGYDKRVLPILFWEQSVNLPNH